MKAKVENQNLYWVAALLHPTVKEMENGAVSELILPPMALLAMDEQAASSQAGMELGDTYKAKKNQVEILVRPF